MRKRDKCHNCKFCVIRTFGKSIVHHCAYNNDPDRIFLPITTVKKCSECKRFKSRYLEFPINVRSIDHSETDNLEYRDTHLFSPSYGKGFKVKLHLVEEGSKKEYTGHFVADCPTTIYIRYNKKNGKLILSPSTNPAFWVPKLNRLVFGYECWWKKI